MPDLSDEAKAEIAAAVQIVASDKGHANIKAIRDHLMPPTPETDPPNPGDPTPPPKKEEDPAPAPPAKRGLWNVGNSDE
jgi:hypothetical protein